MPIENLFQFLFHLSPWVFAKLIICICLTVYLFFGLLVIRQVDLMSKTLNGILNLPLKLIAWIHFVTAIVIFLLSILIL